MAGMSDHYFLDDDGTTIIHCGGGARPQDTHLAIDGALHRIIEWLKRRERRRRRAVKVTERWISSAPLMLWAIVIAMVMFAVMAAKQ